MICLTYTSPDGSTPAHDMTFEQAGRWLSGHDVDWLLFDCPRCKDMLRLFGMGGPVQIRMVWRGDMLINNTAHSAVVSF